MDNNVNKNQEKHVSDISIDVDSGSDSDSMWTPVQPAATFGDTDHSGSHADSDQPWGTERQVYPPDLEEWMLYPRYLLETVHSLYDYVDYYDRQGIYGHGHYIDLVESLGRFQVLSLTRAWLHYDYSFIPQAGVEAMKQVRMCPWCSARFRQLLCPTKVELQRKIMAYPWAFQGEWVGPPEEKAPLNQHFVDMIMEDLQNADLKILPGIMMEPHYGKDVPMKVVLKEPYTVPSNTLRRVCAAPVIRGFDSEKNLFSVTKLRYRKEVHIVIPKEAMKKWEQYRLGFYERSVAEIHEVYRDSVRKLAPGQVIKWGTAWDHINWEVEQEARKVIRKGMRWSAARSDDGSYYLGVPFGDDINYRQDEDIEQEDQEVPPLVEDVTPPDGPKDGGMGGFNPYGNGQTSNSSNTSFTQKMSELSTTTRTFTQAIEDQVASLRRAYETALANWTKEKTELDVYVQTIKDQNIRLQAQVSSLQKEVRELQQAAVDRDRYKFGVDTGDDHPQVVQKAPVTPPVRTTFTVPQVTVGQTTFTFPREESKQTLNRLCQKRGCPLPYYEVQMQGPAAETRIRARAIVGNITGAWTINFNIKVEAENEAARLLIPILENHLERGGSLFEGQPNFHDPGWRKPPQDKIGLPAPVKKAALMSSDDEKYIELISSPDAFELPDGDTTDYKTQVIQQVKSLFGNDIAFHSLTSAAGGPAHMPWWVSTAALGLYEAIGKGRSKKAAEQAVAYQLLKQAKIEYKL